ncbi:MAG: hypothetical protein ACR2ML_10945 [Solirubrobacteraceae bacterium]
MKLTLKQVGAGLAALTGVLASLVGVLSYIDEKRKDPPPTNRKSLQIKQISLHDKAEPLGDFLRKTPNSKGRSYSADELRRPGYSFLLDVRGQGPVGSRLRLRWRLRIAGGDPVPGADYDQVASDFKSAVLDQEERVPVWVPYPIASGRYIVRFTFQRLDDEGHEVGFGDERDSAPFKYVSS